MYTFPFLQPKKPFKYVLVFSFFSVLTDPVERILRRPEEVYIEYIFDFQNYALQFLAVFRNLVHNLQREYQEIAFYLSTFAQEKKVTLINFHYHRNTIFSVIFTKHLSERSGLLVEAKTSGQSLSIINPISHPSLGPQKTMFPMLTT